MIYNIILKNDTIENKAKMEEIFYELVFNGCKFSFQGSELEIIIDSSVNDETAKLISKLSYYSEKILTKRNVKREQNDRKARIKRIKEIEDFAKEAENTTIYKEKIKDFLKGKRISENISPVGTGDLIKCIDGSVNLALQGKEITWNNLGEILNTKAIEKMQHRVNSVIRKSTFNDLESITGLEFLKIIAENAVKYNINQLQQKKAKVKEIRQDESENQYSQQNELTKQLSEKMKNINFDDSIRVKTTKILNILKINDMVEKESMRHFIELVIRQKNFSLEKTLEKIAKEYECSVFEIRMQIFGILSRTPQLPQFNLSEFCESLRKILECDKCDS